jgi:opacity protein-like surface antigen
MKNKNVFWLVSIVLLLLSSPVYSQIKLGFQLGPNFTNSIGLRPDAPYKIESNTYLFGGILAEFKISDVFYIQPEVSFLPKGVTYKRTPWGNPPSPYIEITLDYYEVTANALVKVDMDNFTPFIFVGPSLGFLSKVKAKYDSYETDDSEGHEKTDFSMNFGVGVEFSLSKNIDLFVMARYSLGITDILTDDLAEYKTIGTAIGVGLKFSI